MNKYAPNLKLKMFNQADAPLANGLTRSQLLHIDDNEFETNHGFIQWAFPTPERSLHNLDAPILDLSDAIWLAEQEGVTSFLEAMTERFLHFLSDNKHWVKAYDHNHLRISRAIQSLRILHSWDLSHWFYEQVTNLCGNHLSEMANAVTHWDRNVSSHHDRIAGALMGVAIGDAIGAPVEFQSRGTFAEVTGYQSGGAFDLPAGAWTDDTAMMLCLLDSLLAQNTFDPSDAMNRFCRWAEQGENSSTGVAVGIGQNTLRALGDYRRTGRLKARASGTKNDGNGSLMRTSPIACFFHTNLALARQMASQQSRTTHASDIADQCCSFQVEMLVRLINREEFGSAKLRTLEHHKGTPLHRELCPNFNGVSSQNVPSTGYVMDTLRAAMWSVENSTTAEGAMLLAANLGDDADTVAAVTGQIAGALYGYASMPKHLKSGLAFEREIYVKSQFLSRGEQNRVQ